MKHLNLTLIALLLSFASFALAPITGAFTICVGEATPLSDATTGGTWSSAATGIATIDPSTGVMLGVSAGVATISYTDGVSTVTQPVTVNPLPSPMTLILSPICLGSSVIESEFTPGGMWASSSTTVATISVTGEVFGVTAGTATITYVLPSTGCYVTSPVTVSATASGPITGIASVCVGGTTTLSDIGGGTWSSASPAIAIIDPTGVATGIAPGVVTITNSVGTTCSATMLLTVNDVPASFDVLGTGSVCSSSAGLHISTDGSTAGVSYQLYNGASPVGSAVLGTGGGLDFGLFAIAGSYTVVGTSAAGCASTMVGSADIIVYPAPNVYNIAGGGSICTGGAGLNVTLSGSDLGIDYQLMNGSTPVGAPMAGTGSALTFGPFTTAGSYTITATDPLYGCVMNMSGVAVIAVNPSPTVYTVTGGGTYCSGTSGLHIGLSGSSIGVTYQLDSGTLTVGSPVPGTGTSLDFGLYTAGTYSIVATNTLTGCTSAMTGSAVLLATTLTPSVSIGLSPGGTICTGSSITFTATPVNGGTTPTYTWSVNGTAAGTGTTHTYVPINGDRVKVILTSSLPCASPVADTTSDTVTVITPHINTTTSSICGGAVTIIATGGSSYVWSPATGLPCTTCDTVTLEPTTTTVYTITGTDIYGCVGTTTVTADGNRIFGHISGGITGSIRVWLIQYNSSDSSLTAIDSVMACDDGVAPYYQFNDKPAGNYLVKAFELGGVAGASGFIPTYAASTAYWNAASTLVHGTGNDTMHVNMLYGIVPSGPGFIGGLIVSGAGRGTTDLPAAGILVYLLDAATGNILTYTYTNSSGAYSFTGLANSSYIVSPVSYDFYTIPGYVITLNVTTESATTVDFKKHNTYRIITPYIVNVNVKPLAAANGLSVFPNPTSGNLNVSWDDQAIGTANVVVTDVVGREVYHSAIDINSISGQTQISLNGLNNGIYLITIKSGNNSYNGKLMIQQ